MTCYFRHLGLVFAKAEIIVTPQNRKQLDQVIQELVNTRSKDCPSTWREVKKRMIQDEDDFAANLKEAWIKAQTQRREK